MSRRQESYSRLGALGHLSDHYSDVASVGGRSSAWSTDDESQWELESNSSKASGLAVVFDKGPPPGYQARKSTVSESTRASSPGGRSDVSGRSEHHVLSSLAKKPYVIHGDAIQPRTFDTTQLRPAKDLRRTRHPSVLRPGAGSRRASSEYGVSNSREAPGFPISVRPNKQCKGQGRHRGRQRPETAPTFPSTVNDEYADKGLQHPAVLRPGQAHRPRVTSDYGDQPMSKSISYSSYKPQEPLYSHATTQDKHTPRSISTYSAYHPPEAEPSEELRNHSIRTYASLRESPSTTYGGFSSEYDDARSNYTNVTHSHSPQPASHLSSRRNTPSIGENVDDQQPPQFPPRHPSAGAIARVDGVDFDMVSATVDRAPAFIATPISPPTPAPTQSISATRGRGREKSISSTYSRSTRSPSPAYGAWNPDPPRQRRPSFFKRAQAHFERNVHETLVKAGRRPAPSFKVIKVEKSPTTDVEMWPENEGRKSVASSPPDKIPRRERFGSIQGGQELVYVGHGGTEVQPAAPAPGTEKPGEGEEDWEISSDSEAGIESETELSRTNQRLSKAPRPTPRGTPSASAMRRRPNLRIDTSFDFNFDFNLVPAATSRRSSALDFKPLPEPPSPPSEEEQKDESDAARLPSAQSSDDSLFLGSRDGGIRGPASHSFFASEYAQRRIGAQMERAASHPQRSSNSPPPRAHSSASPYRESQDDGAEFSRPRSSVALTREQVQFAALPSPLEDLWQPFPFDSRRDLPSQTMQRDAAKRRALSKKKGIQRR
ncbi:hypothetical protein ANO14919_039230 [Xylariales sp. No.14919]|nr:hypothetical protein ANO14919_039230 [Xylariales sp. No.14919]